MMNTPSEHPRGGEEYQIRVEKLVYGGEALGRLPDGRAVFVPFALPDELVRLGVQEQKRTFARGELLEVMEPSPERIEPRCPHFTTCGGCHYQHITHDFQSDVKREILIDQLERIGGLQSPTVEACAASGVPWQYRNHMQFHVDESGAMGFQSRRSRDLICVQECHLPNEAIQSVWPGLKISSGSGIQRVVMRAGSQGEIVVIVEGGSIDAVEFPDGAPVSAVHRTAKSTRTICGDGRLIYSLHGRDFTVSTDSFFQTNLAVAESMVSHLLENIPFDASCTLLELYSGVGLFSAFFAPLVKRLVAVESAASVWDDFSANLAEFDNVELYQDSAENVLSVLKDSVDILVVDPPRTGLHPRVLEAVVDTLRPQFIAYVSCDPATLARDGKKLISGGYRMIRTTPFDMFPQTFHIESISYWQRG